MAKSFRNPAEEFLPMSNNVEVKEENKNEIKVEKNAKEKTTKITIEISLEDSMKINRIVDVHKMLNIDSDIKYTKKWFLTKSVKEAIEKNMKELGITLL